MRPLLLQQYYNILHGNVINLYKATFLTDEPISLKAFKYPKGLYLKISDLITDDDLGIISDRVENHKNSDHLKKD